MEGSVEHNMYYVSEEDDGCESNNHIPTTGRGGEWQEQALGEMPEMSIQDPESWHGRIQASGGALLYFLITWSFYWIRNNNIFSVAVSATTHEAKDGQG